MLTVWDDLVVSNGTRNSLDLGVSNGRWPIQARFWLELGFQMNQPIRKRRVQLSQSPRNENRVVCVIRRREKSLQFG
jgi:hypothetical protein